MRFSIRKYRPTDFPTLLAIDQSCFEPGIAYTAYELKTYILRRTAFAFVAELDNGSRSETASDVSVAAGSSTLGFIVGERSRGIGHIITIDVCAEARRHRVGSVLLKTAEEELRYWKCDVVRLETAVNNLTALEFYKRHGFVVVKTIPHYYSNGLDALLLEKDLLSAPSSS